MKAKAVSYHGYRFPPEIISRAVWLYSFRIRDGRMRRRFQGYAHQLNVIEHERCDGRVALGIEVPAAALRLRQEPTVVARAQI